jgi:hypothetical protein
MLPCSVARSRRAVVLPALSEYLRADLGDVLRIV